jgi:hypothetical protein
MWYNSSAAPCSALSNSGQLPLLLLLLLKLLLVLLLLLLQELLLPVRLSSRPLVQQLLLATLSKQVVLLAVQMLPST